MVAEDEEARRVELAARKKASGKAGNTPLGFLPPEDPIYSRGPTVSGRRLFAATKKSSPFRHVLFFSLAEYFPFEKTNGPEETSKG